MNKKMTAYACIAILTGIALGAFGAHGLKRVTSDPAILSGYQTGVDYHLFHALAFLVFGLWGSAVRSIPLAKSALRLMVIGVLIFSGSLYLLTAFRAVGWSYSWIAPITPIGGTLLILAWAWLAYGLLRRERSN